ncbi:MAG: cytochrome-c oxidase [Alphaproteobacteria bacterium]|nr:cytochrome-c oxidase [Alphaproteobacteria bacterium]
MLASRFLRLSIIYALAGVALGIFMAASHDLSQMPTHAHINLLGFVSTAIYGFFYRAYPGAEQGWLARAHFWIANLGFIVLMGFVAAFHAGYTAAEMGAAAMSFVVLLGLVLFAVIVFKATARSA